MFKHFKNNNYDQKRTKLRQIRDKIDQNMSKNMVKKQKKSLQILGKPFREPAREARRHPEDVPSAGARSAPEPGRRLEPVAVSGALARHNCGSLSLIAALDILNNAK